MLLKPIGDFCSFIWGLGRLSQTPWQRNGSLHVCVCVQVSAVCHSTPQILHFLQNAKISVRIFAFTSCPFCWHLWGWHPVPVFPLEKKKQNTRTDDFPTSIHPWRLSLMLKNPALQAGWMLQSYCLFVTH